MDTKIHTTVILNSYNLEHSVSLKYKNSYPRFDTTRIPHLQNLLNVFRKISIRVVFAVDLDIYILLYFE